MNKALPNIILLLFLLTALTKQMLPLLTLKYFQIEVNVSALLRVGHKESAVANLVGVSCTTVYAIKKRIDDGEGVNRRAGSGRMAVVDRDSLRDAILVKDIARSIHSRIALE